MQQSLDKLLKEMKDISWQNRTANFQCVVVFLRDYNDPTPIICQGEWAGRITFVPDGTNGFGYDPVFWVPAYNCTAAKLAAAVKNTISHRAQALQKLLVALKQQYLSGNPPG